MRGLMLLLGGWLLALVNSAWCQTSTGGAEPLVGLEMAEHWPIEHATHHVQGLAATPDWFWITSVDRATRSGWIYQFDRATRRVVAERRIERGEQFHPGGVQLQGKSLWVPVAEYRPRSSSTVLRLDAQTLAEEAAFAVEDHLGAIAADGKGTLWAVNWDSRAFYVFSESGALKRQFDSATGVAYQDLEWHEEYLWALGSTKLEGVPTAVVDQLRPDDGKLIRRWVLAGRPKRGGLYSREGFSRLGSDLFVLPEDGPHTQVYRFAMPIAEPNPDSGN